MAGRDAFKIHVNQKHKPVSRRGILATVSSVFDPLGFVSPFVLRGRLLLREMCRSGLDWDETIPEAAETAWTDWIQDMTSLQGIEIPRCYSPSSLHSPAKIELHHFSDASVYGYGQCSYVRTVDDEGHVCSTLAISKCRVTPSRPITIPRLEIMAAELSVKASVFLREELKIPDITEHFWTDSRVVLGHISNEARKFRVFVANRLQRIREATDPDAWRYVNTEENPADLALRGLKAADLVNNQLWWHGPKNLLSDDLPEVDVSREVEQDDEELKKATAFVATSDEVKPYFDLVDRLQYFSDWQRATVTVATCRRYLKILKGRVRARKERVPFDSQELMSPLTIQELQEAEVLVLKTLQVKEGVQASDESSPGDSGRRSHLRGLDPTMKGRSSRRWR